MNSVAIAAFIVAALVPIDMSAPRPGGLLPFESIVSDQAAFQWGTTQNGLSVGLAETGPYLAKQAIPVRVALRNDSDDTQYFRQPFLRCWLTISNEAGRVVPIRPKLFVSTLGGGSRYTGFTIISGDAMQESMDIASLYALKSGQYRVQASMWVDKRVAGDGVERASETLKSAPVTIQIR